MTLNELIDSLESIRKEIAANTNADEDSAGEAEVYMAYQPNYPLQSDVDTVTAMKQVEGGGRDDYRSKESDVVVYLGSGSHSAYAPGSAWEGGYVEDEEETEEDE